MAITGTEIGGRERATFVCDSAGSLLTVRIRGEIDHHTAGSIRQGIDALLYERRPRKLLLDLSAVTFMDSSGLGLIMGRFSVVRELGGELVVWNPSRETQSILYLAGMERMVRIEYPQGEASCADRRSARSADRQQNPRGTSTRTSRTPRQAGQTTHRQTGARKEKDA